jgi:phosphatidylglycerophosphatase A
MVNKKNLENNRSMDRFKNYGHRTNLINVARILATWFGTGLLPKAPGTWGSLSALPIGYAITTWGGAELLGTLTVLFFIIGVWASNVTSNETGIADPSEIVIDEVVGQWITLLSIPPNIILYFLAFVLFRLFDIWKPWPISWADEKIKGGFGVMLDDVLAAILAVVSLWLGQIAYEPIFKV